MHVFVFVFCNAAAYCNFLFKFEVLKSVVGTIPRVKQEGCLSRSPCSNITKYAILLLHCSSFEGGRVVYYFFAF